MFLNDFCLSWLQGYACWIKSSTYKAYLCALKHVPQLDMANLSHRHIQELIKQMHAQGLALSTIKHTITIIRQAVLYAEQNGLYEGHINFDLMRYPEKPKHLVRALTANEQRKLLGVCNESIHGDLFRCLLLTGMRVGEAIALTWSDIDFENRVIHIRATNYRGIIQTPKTSDGIRDVYICDALYNLLWERSPAGAGSNDVVFCGRYGEFVNYRSALKAFHRLCDLAGIGDYSIHALRHTFATNAIVAKVPMKTVSDILGHSSITVTMDIYAQTSLEQQAACMDSISGCVFGAREQL